ncbi:hypothetical protein COJ51_16220 [Bacillus thuringiensis]|uniref:hypothetical protein n=1 Tax=Bacillus thuringiensis TaxID=1428 RepID=UPI000BF961DA|nr:hypothetical protein [Bacillus thuringiensis]PFN03470.1 hypothetical protein COJ51_16220 [Bacillus thuringiensis]
MERNVLLQYDLLTEPSPLRVSPADGDRRMARITLVISNPHETPVICSLIRIKMEIGDYAHNLTDVPQGIRIEMSPSDPTHWSFSYDGHGTVELKAQTKRARKFTSEALTVTLSNIAVNREPGTFELQVEEEAGYEDDFIDLHITNFSATKFPEEPWIEKFQALPDEIDPGQETTLTWHAAEQAHYLLSRDDGETVDVSYLREWKAQRLNCSTTFTLSAIAQAHGESLEIKRHVHVRVRRPEIQDVKAEPNVLKKQWGEKVKLSWKVNKWTEYGELMTGNGILIKQWRGDGEAEVIPDSTNATYILRAYYKDIVSAEKVVTIALDPGDVEFKSRPEIAYPGQLITVEWKCPPDAKVLFEGQEKQPVGSQEVAVGTDGVSIYWLRYQQQGGMWVERRLPVQVGSYELFFTRRTFELTNTATDGTVYTYRFQFTDPMKLLFTVLVSGMEVWSEDMWWEREEELIKVHSQEGDRFRLLIKPDALVLIRVLESDIPYAFEKHQNNSIPTKEVP